MSSPEVRITLGRSGQVVFKGGKRSRGEGHGSNGDNLFFSSNKRNRGGGVKWSPLNRVNGSQIDKNDLRLKLMRKRSSNKTQNFDETKDPSKKPMESSHPMSSRTYMMTHGHVANVFAGSSTRPPNRNLEGYSSRLSPPRNFEKFQRVQPVRYSLGDETIDSSRMTSSPHAMMKATSQTSNPVTRVAPRSSIIQPGVEPQTVGGFLNSLGLGKYAVSFQAEEVDMTVLKQMGEKDLKEMGIPMGPRKKILLSLVARMKRQAL